MRNVHTHKPIDVRGGLISRRHRPAPAVHGGCEEAAGASLEHDLLVESDQKVCTGGRGESESSLRWVKGVRKGRVCPVHAARKDKKLAMGWTMSGCQFSVVIFRSLLTGVLWSISSGQLSGKLYGSFEHTHRHADKHTYTYTQAQDIYSEISHSRRQQVSQYWFGIHYVDADIIREL